jgi:hypothetical protein
MGHPEKQLQKLQRDPSASFGMTRLRRAPSLRYGGYGAAGHALKLRRLIPTNQPPYAWSFVDVDADIEAAVVPIGFVIAAPLAVAIHFGDVVLHLRTVVSVACGVVIDFGFIGVEAVAAIA